MNPLLTYKIAIASPLRRLFDYLPRRSGSPPLTPGMRVLVPFGRRKEVGIVVEGPVPCELPREKLKSIEQVLDGSPAIDQELMSLCLWAARYYHHSPGEVLHHALPVLLRAAGHDAEEMEVRWLPTEKGCLVPQDSFRRAPRQWQVLSVLRDHPSGLTIGTLRHLGVEPSHLTPLLQKGLAETLKSEPDVVAFSGIQPLADTPLPPNPDQAAALASIRAGQGFRAFLLAGVTGSGKTEVYLQAIEDCLRRGRQALVLVPEIGLTPQTLGRFRQRFSVPVTALHSGLSDGERLRAWRAARHGACGIVIGTRSAIFTPLKAAGLIIVDEEHDGSFKQQDGFRYSARDLALVRGRHLDVPVILGSATPSLESLHNARMERHVLLSLPRRAGSATPPRWQIADIKARPMVAGLADVSLDTARTHLAQGGQVMFFINRRGYAPTLLCHDCGWHSDCKRCDAHLTLHREPPHLHCHHCDSQSPIPRFCPQCGGSDIRPQGQGTERIEEELASLFPTYPVVRIDRDTAQSQKRLQERFDIVHRGAPCLLVGTQMLAKGHHFPQVSLVVILNVDGGLFSGNFRALEHAGQLIEQVAGRAGRAERPGTVLLQTHHPDHPALQLLVRSGYLALADQLLMERQVVELPPFGYLAVIRSEAPRAEDAHGFLAEAKQAAEGMAGEAVAVFGPLPAIMEKRAGRFRFQLVIKSRLRPALHAFLTRWLPLLESLPGQRRTRWHLDVDPVNFDD